MACCDIRVMGKLGNTSIIYIHILQLTHDM